jgi:RNA polymerase sigma factor (sigma-70 family)
MARGRLTQALRHLHGLFGRGDPAARPDHDLLDAFAQGRDEGAFAALVGRHGPLVWGVCRRLLAHEQDAEDAFQATFLVLARKAGAVAWRTDVGNWLYAVALRVSRRARGRAERQRLRERAADVRPEAVPEQDPARAELAALIDEEIDRLPAKYRRPVVLCCLEGKTYAEAARLLGWPAGTTSARLARARELLRRRLTRRGLALAALPPVFVSPAAAAPAAPSALTARHAAAFAAGRGAPGAATDLVEGVLQTMFRSKLKFVTLAVAILALAGAGAALVASGLADANPPANNAPPASVTVVPDAPRPAPRKEWADRWIADPFAGAEWVEVRHSRRASLGYQIYRITDKQAVTAVVKAAKIIGVQNDVAAGCLPSAWVIIHYPGGRTFTASMCGSGDTLMCDGGILTFADGFTDALEKAVAAEAKMKVNLGEPLPAPEGTFAPPSPPATAKNLESGFKALDVTYSVGRHLHRTVIDDEKTLDALHKALVLRAAVPLGKEKAESRNLQVTTKDKAHFYFQVQGRESIVDLNVGRFVLTPSFFDALNKEVSRRASFDIDVTADDNKPPTKAEERVAEFRKLLGRVKSLRFVEKRNGNETALVFSDAKEVSELVGAVRRVSVPAKEIKLAPGNKRVEMKLDDGRIVTVTYLDPGKDNREAEAQSAMPLLTEPAEVSGFGQVWLDNQWRSLFRDLAYRRQREAKDRRDAETARLVCADLPAFFKQAISVVAVEKNTRGPLSPDGTRKVLNALAAGTFEKLDWDEERWRKEYEKLGEPDLELQVAPGLGFSLILVPAGETEFLVLGSGRLTFARSPLPAIRKAVKESFKE